MNFSHSPSVMTVGSLGSPFVPWLAQSEVVGLYPTNLVNWWPCPFWMSVDMFHCWHPRQTIEKCNIEAPIAKKFKIRLLRIGALRRGGRMKRADEDRASSSFFWPAALLHQLCPLEIIDTDNGHSSEEAPHQKAGKWSRKKARVPSSNGCSHFLRLDSHPKPLSGENISFGVGFYIWAGSRWPNLSYSSTSNLKKSPPQIKKKSRLKSKYSSTSNQKHHWLWFMLCFICTTCTISSSLDTLSNVKYQIPS